MSFGILRQGVLGSYYLATLPSRRRAAWERAALQKEPIRVLFYHRVADDHPNDWTMSTRTFARQIHWLRARFELVSLAEAQARISAGSNQVPTACITFDDGYADNMRFAVPLLLKHNVPFTYFVATKQVLFGKPFPHDIHAGQPLSPNTPHQLRNLAAAGVDIGCHTRGHSDLGGNLTPIQLADEILGGKRELEQAIARDVRFFAFPYGQHSNLTQAAFRVAYESGYAGVCSAYGGYNFPGDDSFHLRRIHADPEMARFKNWLTIDPRKLKMHRDFDPGDFRGPKPRSIARVGHGEKGRGGEIAPAIKSPTLPLSPSPTLGRNS
jgi:peptidoglycan/xylan/chitin deacetylase (PgdA/CDA1 family)